MSPVNAGVDDPGFFGNASENFCLETQQPWSCGGNVMSYSQT